MLGLLSIATDSSIMNCYWMNVCWCHNAYHRLIVLQQTDAVR